MPSQMTGVGSPIANAVMARKRLSDVRQRIGLEGGGSQMRQLAPMPPNGPANRPSAAMQAVASPATHVAPATAQTVSPDRQASMMNMARRFLGSYRPPARVKAQPAQQPEASAEAIRPVVVGPSRERTYQAPAQKSSTKPEMSARQQAVGIVETLSRQLGRVPTPDEVRLYLTPAPKMGRR